MATNPSEKQEANKNPPPLFGGGLFGNPPAPGTGFFGNAAKPGLGGSLFGAPSPSSAPTTFSPAGQQQPITPLFGNTSGQPQSAPSSMETNKAPSLFSGGLGALGASKPAEGGQNKLGFGLFGQGVSNSPIPSFFGPPKTAGQPEQPLATSFTPANPAPTTTTPLTLSFGSTQQPKKEEPAKKNEAPSLFGSSGASTGPLFGGTSLFGQAAKPAEVDKKDQKKPALGSLFGGLTSSVTSVHKEFNAPKKSETPFGLSNITPTTAPTQQASKAPPSKAPQVKETPAQQIPKNPLAGSLFSGNPSGSLFGASSSGSSAPSLFGGVTPTPLSGISPVPTTTPAPSLFQAPTPKAPSLFGGPPTGSLFGAPVPSSTQPPAAITEKPKPAEASSTLLSQSMPKPQKPAPKQSQQGLTLTSKTEGSGKPQPPKPAASTLLSNDSKQPKKDGATMPSLFGGSTAIGLFSNKPTEPTPIPPPKTQPLSTASQPKPIFQSRPDTALPSLTERRRKEPAADPEQSQTIRSNQSAESSVLTKEKTHNDFATRQSKNTGIAETADTGNGPKLFSFLKPRQANTAELLDFKALMQERDGEMFSTFLSQSSKRIISSIKLYFTVRREPFKPKEQPPNNTQKERFFFDFANLFMKVQGLSDQSYPLVGQFLKRVISDQRYERLLFKDGALSVEYFRNHMIYQVGLGNTFFLNQAGSRELQFLVERMVNKWNVQRVGILNFLLGHSDLMKKPSDLFSYLFRHLLQMDGKHIQTQNKQYSTFIKDFEYLTKKKLLQVIAFYNGRLREFKLIPPEQIKGIVMLLQSNKDEAVNEVALKVLLNSLNFKQPKEIPGDVFQAIRQTKSECMMPLRALAHKLTSKRHDFVPPPKELYKYIRGDQWVDWFDIYLSDSGRQGVQLQTGEAEQILQSLCSISGPLLLQRMMDSRKGLQRFFNLLRDQNMVTLYYRLLQACVYDEKSITKVNQFYFQKMHFNLEYQQVIEYVIAFNQQQPHANEEVVLAVLEVKLGLLAKIIQVAPEKLVELERFLFYHDYNRHKKFRANVPQECPRAQGEKLVHLFLDTVNIVSLKGIPNRILHRIFRVLAHLLRSQQTQEVALTALRTNRPSFAFLSAPLHPLTLNAINSLLEQVLSGHYLHDLAADYAQAREDEVRSQSFYPFRYRDAELGNLMRHQTTGTVGSGQFSIYWMNQLVRVVAKQRFNPQLLFKMLQKLHIEPYSPQGQAISGPFIGGLYQKRSLQNRIPTIFEPIVSVLNQVAVWEQVARVLQYKIVRCDGKLQLANKLILTSPSLESERTLLFTLKLVRLCFQLNTLLGKYQQSADSHFVVRTLSAVNFLSRGKIGSQFATNASRNSILLSLVALLHLEGCQNDGTQGISWQAEQAQEEDTAQQALIQFLNRNRQILDFQQASNFLRRPTNSLYEAENSIVGVSLQVMLDIIRLSPQCSLEHSLTTFLPLKEDEKTQLKVQVLNKLSSVVAKAVDDPRIDYRIIDFLYHLKYDCGMNKLHGALSNRLFDQFLKSQRKDAERSVSFKSSVTRYLMKELSEGNKNYQTFTEQFLQKAVGELRFRDTILRDGRQFKEMREVGKMVRNYHSKEHSLLSLNQLERMVEERAIVEIGRHMQTLSNSIDILMGQLIRRKHSQGLLNCLCVLNHLILAKNLLLLEQDLPDSARTRPTATNSQPRLYLRDPLQAYISQGGVGKHGIAQLQQKNNIVEWLLSRATTLSNKITSYFMFILTIDRYLYANNPVSFTVDRPDIVRLDLFCHLALGSFNFTATELFGKNSTDAVETVQGLASNLLGRLTELTKGQVREGGDETYRQGLRMVGYCLQWLRGKEKHGETASQYLIRKLQKNFQVLLPSPSHFLTPQALKVLLSALSMGVKNFSPEARTQVRQAVYAIVERYWQVLQRGLAQQERAIGELFQQAATVLILLPPEKNEAFAFELLVNIWTRERNFQFFFNESRLMIELARVCPQELVKLQPLTRCQIITALSPRYSRYSDDERRFDGVAWTWAMRVAAELANHPLSILVVSQVSAFLKKYRERIQALFENGDKLSKSYLQDLQVALQLLASLFSHDLWVNFNRKLAEEITYLLSHKLIRVFVLYAQGRLTFAPFSSNDKQLSSVKCLGDEESPFDSLTQETVFSTEMRIRLNYCLRNYCLVMSKAFRSSHYVETYFETSVLETSKYFSSFWDGFGKQLTTLFVYASKQFKLWSGLRKLNEALSTMTQCAAAPHSFVENGYLCTVGQLPRNDYELYSDLYLLNYLLTELAAVHLLKERLYVGRFNSLMGTHADAFAKRIREHVEGVRVESKRINVDMGQYVGETEFNGVVQLIQSARATK